MVLLGAGCAVLGGVRWVFDPVGGPVVVVVVLVAAAPPAPGGGRMPDRLARPPRHGRGMPC